MSLSGQTLNKRFWLEKITPDNTLSKIYLYFLPHHQYEGGVGPSAHFRITVRADNPISGDAPVDLFSGSSLTVGNSTNNIAIFRYMLGIDQKNADGTLITTLAAAQLDCIRRWVESRTGSRYGVHE
jgi:hypothetical protein